MKISLIAAIDNNRTIGIDNQLPWHLPADLMHFKQKTLGKPILMGRLTHESIGRPLPGRTNIILTHQSEYKAPGCAVIHSLDAISTLNLTGAELMVIGGASIYAALIDQADILYLTLVDTSIQGDKYFPPWQPNAWNIQERIQRMPDEKNMYAMTFLTLVRV